MGRSIQAAGAQRSIRACPSADTNAVFLPMKPGRVDSCYLLVTKSCEMVPNVRHRLVDNYLLIIWGQRRDTYFSVPRPMLCPEAMINANGTACVVAFPTGTAGQGDGYPPPANGSIWNEGPK